MCFVAELIGFGDGLEVKGGERKQSQGWFNFQHLEGWSCPPFEMGKTMGGAGLEGNRTWFGKCWVWCLVVHLHGELGVGCSSEEWSGDENSGFWDNFISRGLGGERRSQWIRAESGERVYWVKWRKCFKKWDPLCQIKLKVKMKTELPLDRDTWKFQCLWWAVFQCSWDPKARLGCIQDRMRKAVGDSGWKLFFRGILMRGEVTDVRDIDSRTSFIPRLFVEHLPCLRHGFWHLSHLSEPNQKAHPGEDCILVKGGNTQ